MKARISSPGMLFCAVGVLCCGTLSIGCGTDSAKMSKQEIQNFHGGPMPPDAAAKMAKRQADLQKSEPSAYKDWLAKRQADMAKRGRPSAAPPAASKK
ncbi:MAG TPA: hypothetical protein VFW40_14060 [Capsulimonadaceae bacterium]|nr:hypothetical protein [Capsulimonadaceae bacterium]